MLIFPQQYLVYGIGLYDPARDRLLVEKTRTQCTIPLWALVNRLSLAYE
jgi:hypothetical protein